MSEEKHTMGSNGIIDDVTIGSVFARPLEVVSDLAQEKARAETEAELKRPLFEDFTLEGRTFMVDTTKKCATEIKERKKDQLLFPRVGSLQGVADLVRRHGNPTNAVVVVGTDGIQAHFAISADEDEQRPTLACPYFHGDDAPPGAIGIESLFAWLDRFHGELGQSEISANEEDAIWAAISGMRATVADEYQVNSQGGAIEITTKTKQGVGSTQEGKLYLPKYITVRQRLGVRDFKAPCLYRLMAILPTRDRRELSFQLIRMDTDGAHEKFVAWAVAGLQELLNGTVTGVLDEAVAQPLVDSGDMTSVDEPVEAPNDGPWIVCEGP